MISSYFSRTGLKRNHSSTSDESDVEDSDMAVQTALDNISKRLDTLVTKVDVDR